MTGVSLVATFKNLSQVTRKKLQLSYADKQAKKVFSTAPLFPSEARET